MGSALLASPEVDPRCWTVGSFLGPGVARIVLVDGFDVVVLRERYGEREPDGKGQREPGQRLADAA